MNLDKNKIINDVVSALIVVPVTFVTTAAVTAIAGVVTKAKANLVADGPTDDSSESTNDNTQTD